MYSCCFVFFNCLEKICSVDSLVLLGAGWFCPDRKEKGKKNGEWGKEGLGSGEGSASSFEISLLIGHRRGVVIVQVWPLGQWRIGSGRTTAAQH